jgi:hypothetical protein
MIDHKRRSIKIFRDMSLGDLASTLEKLSMEMNNQILLITTINYENEIRILKYQENSLWGMKIMLDADIYSKKENLFSYLMNNYGIDKVYNVNNSKVFDLGSDLLRVYSFIKEITTNIFNIHSDIKLNFVFEKKSLAILPKLKSN